MREIARICRHWLGPRQEKYDLRKPDLGLEIKNTDQRKNDRTEQIDVRRRIQRHPAVVARRGIAEPVGQPGLGEGSQDQDCEQEKVKDEPGADIPG